MNDQTKTPSAETQGATTTDTPPKETDAAKYQLVSIKDMESIQDGRYMRARASLGATAFGLGLLTIRKGQQDFIEHDHGHDLQEEVYFFLNGEGTITLDGEKVEFVEGQMLRVAPDVTRYIEATSDRVICLAISGRPGEGYEAPSWTNLGEPDHVEEKSDDETVVSKAGATDQSTSAREADEANNEEKNEEEKEEESSEKS